MSLWYIENKPRTHSWELGCRIISSSKVKLNNVEQLDQFWVSELYTLLSFEEPPRHLQGLCTSQAVAQNLKCFGVLADRSSQGFSWSLVPNPQTMRSNWLQRVGLGDGSEIVQVRECEDDGDHLAETWGPPERCGLFFGACQGQYFNQCLSRSCVTWQFAPQSFHTFN